MITTLPILLACLDVPVAPEHRRLWPAKPGEKAHGERFAGPQAAGRAVRRRRVNLDEEFVARRGGFLDVRDPRHVWRPVRCAHRRPSPEGGLIARRP
jgi:hypothetical protein